tara:strand:+ start:994 stop:1818 length:825 start_codon:yes stop_codon:yes gene_type:complete
LKDNYTDSLKEAANAIHEADHVLISAGAGASVDSGLPDYRGNEGFWTAYPALKAQNITYREISSCDEFINNPRRAWGFYGHCLDLYQKSKPHDGYTILKNILDSKKGKGFVYTSNVDGFFERAGFNPNQIIEIHGSIHHLQCSVKCTNEVWHVNSLNVQVDPKSFLATSGLPTCPHCGKIARPNILFFNEGYWSGQRVYHQENNFQNWKRSLWGAKVVAIEVGAGGDIPFVRTESAKYDYHIRINPSEEEQTGKAIHIQDTGLSGLHALAEQLR